MDEKMELFRSYGSAFRSIINAKVQPTKKTIREVLKLSKAEDWAFLCSAMDIIDDTCMAIDNFLKFGLDGPTKYNEDGERYLRLYGILSATYIQQEAVLKLYQLVNVPPTLKDGRDMIDLLEIRLLRHKLSSHSTNYLDKKSGIIETYIPVRFNLRGFNCEYINNENDEMHSINLQKAISQHFETMLKMQDRILDKAIKTFYSGQETSAEYKKYSEILRELQIVHKGGLVIKSPNGNKVINFKDV